MKDSSNDHEQFPAFPFLSSNQHLDETNFGKPWSDNPFSPFAAPSKGASATDLDSHDGTAATVSTSGSHTTTEGETTSLGCSSSKNNHHSGSSRPRRNHNNNRKGNMGLGDNGVDSDFLGSLDEAFAKGPSKPSNSKTATTPTSSRRTRGSSPHGDKSVTSHGSQERRHTTSSNAPVRGLARQRSQKRASIAAAVSLMAVGGADKASDIADRRIPRRSKTHEDRLQAAAKMGDLNTGISLGGHAAADNSHTEPRPRRGSRNNNNSKRQEEMFYDDEIHSDEDNESYEAYDRKEDRREKRGGGRRHTKGRSDSDVDLGYGETHQHHQSGGGGRRQNRRQSSDNDPYMGGEGPQTPGGRRNRRNTDSDVELEYGDTREPARRPRLTGKGASKSFDESVGNLRARRRRASVMGANAPSEHTEKTDATGYRARAGRRRASVMGDGGGGGGGGGVARGEPPARGVRENLSGRRARRATMSVGTPAEPDFGEDLGYDDAEPDFRGGGGGGMDDSQMDDAADQERQQRLAERANKQKNMLERLRKAKEEQEQPEEGSLDGLETAEEPEPEPEVKPRSRRRASIGIPKKFSMSTNNFASFDPDEGKKDDRKKDDRKKDMKRGAGKPERTGKTPARAKSSESGVTAGSGPTRGGRARAADTDRRMRGSMLDRIGG